MSSRVPKGSLALAWRLPGVNLATLLFKGLAWGRSPHLDTSQPSLFLCFPFFSLSLFSHFFTGRCFKDRQVQQHYFDKEPAGKGGWGVHREGQDLQCVAETLETRDVAFLTLRPVLSPRFSDAILQIDFPTSAFDIKFTSPPGDKFSPRYEFGSLREEDQRVLQNIMQKESLYW